MGKVAGMSYLKEQEHWCRGHGRAGKHWHCGSDTDRRTQNSVYHTQSTMTLWQWHWREEAELVYHTQSTMTLWQWHWQEEAELALSHPVNHDTVAVTLTGGGRTRLSHPVNHDTVAVTRTGGGRTCLSHPVNHDTVAVTLTGGGRTRFITPSQPWHCGSDTDRRQNSVYHTQSTMVVTSGRHTNSDGLKLNEMVVRNRTSEIIDSGCWLEIGL